MLDANLVFHNIGMSLNLLKHYSTLLPQEVSTRVEGRPRPDTNRNINIPTNDDGPYNFSISFRR